MVGADFLFATVGGTVTCLSMFGLLLSCFLGYPFFRSCMVFLSCILGYCLITA